MTDVIFIEDPLLCLDTKVIVVCCDSLIIREMFNIVHPDGLPPISAPYVESSLKYIVLVPVDEVASNFPTATITKVPVGRVSDNSLLLPLFVLTLDELEYLTPIFVFKRNLRIMTYEHHPVALAGHYFYEGRPR